MAATALWTRPGAASEPPCREDRPPSRAVGVDAGVSIKSLAPRVLEFAERGVQGNPSRRSRGWRYEGAGERKWGEGIMEREGNETGEK